MLYEYRKAYTVSSWNDLKPTVVGMNLGSHQTISVYLYLKDGTVLSERVDAVRGTPRNPMNEKEVVAKASDLMAPILGVKQSNNLINTVLNIEGLKNITSLSKLLQKN
jgi:2-methylcitrate dehydratase PrpD